MSTIVPPTNLKCSTHFYFEPLIFQVDDELFQLPRILFTECKTFADLYPEIRTGSGPVILRDCTKKQFEAFLTAVLEPLYRMLPSDHPCSEPLQLDALLFALDLTKRWGFDQLSEDLSSNVSAVKKITLGRDHKIVSWFQSGLEELVLSEDDINLADAEEMGAMFAVRVYHARAKYWRKSQGGSVNVSEIVEEIFAKELQEIANSPGDPPPQPSESSIQQIDEDAAPSDAESDDGDIGMLQLPGQSNFRPYIQPATSSLAMTTSGATQDQQMKIVIRAVFGNNPHQTRSSPQLMSIVPKICQKKEEKCGDIFRTDPSRENACRTDASGEDNPAAKYANDVA
ncbi:hypothetical protein Moror_10280 [Moniliophthora roreri MCA 2997]|uniref:BTB domain-containing protein n=2 Tax=Moniliophthora roreri TaxID=221103 RepID=V2WZ14_MONRO|nr:hypothetical protein Moror_10280 [Moniliophthora roreri MCA 2997]KAI3604649.1 hypothetical protein WG66_008373 [Moniliophthora roreri]